MYIALVILYIPMTIRRNEVEAAMHSIVNDITAIKPTLVTKKSLELIINILDD